jgi:hypothetical protein
VVTAALEVATLVRSERKPRSMFGTPAWYEPHCDAVSRAVWLRQLTEAEATFQLAFWHRLLMLEMKRRNLWRKPRRSNGRGQRRRTLRRFRGRRCPSCGELVGAFTGICAPCHFEGWRVVTARNHNAGTPAKYAGLAEAKRALSLPKRAPTGDDRLQSPGEGTPVLEGQLSVYDALEDRQGREQ